MVTSINFDMTFLMSIKTTLANDKSQQLDLYYGSQLVKLEKTFTNLPVVLLLQSAAENIVCCGKPNVSM